MLLALDSSVVLSEHTSFSLESNSQMLAPTASGSSRSRGLRAVVEGEESALSQERGNDESQDDDNTFGCSNATAATSTDG